MNNINTDFNLMTIDDIQEEMKIGRDKARSIMRLPSLGSIKIGSSYVVTRKNFNRWLEESSGTEVLLQAQNT